MGAEGYVAIENIVSAVELADMLNVTRQGVLWLHTNRAKTGFPAAIKRVSFGYLWDEEAVLRWAKETGRLDADGRPTKRSDC